MVNDQYSIPKSNMQDVEPVYIRPTPERETGPYWGIKAVESRIFSYRAAALESQPKAKKWLGGLVSVPSHQPTMAELIEEESRLGGAMFGPNHSFWLDVESYGGNFPGEVADWYHMQPNPEDPKKPIVLRFQTTAQKVHKLYNGVEYAPTVEDLGIFVKAVEAYSQAILPLYPLDQTINELIHEN